MKRLRFIGGRRTQKRVEQSLEIRVYAYVGGYDVCLGG